jgi:hypothetical protein
MVYAQTAVSTAISIIQRYRDTDRQIDTALPQPHLTHDPLPMNPPHYLAARKERCLRQCRGKQLVRGRERKEDNERSSKREEGAGGPLGSATHTGGFLRKVAVRRVLHQNREHAGLLWEYQILLHVFTSVREVSGGEI